MTYQERKESARQKAIETQTYLAEHATSWAELAEIQTRLETLARRYGLVKEFKDNGII